MRTASPARPIAPRRKIARARFAIYGTNVYPDATFSLRLSYGKVEGWTDNGVTVPPFTYYKGLWERATGQFPFELAPRWQAAQSQGQSRTPCWISSATTTSSAAIPVRPSSMPRAKWWARLSTAISKAWAAPSDFDDRVNRTVSVSTAAITEALRNVYGNETLAAELTGRTRR